MLAPLLQQYNSSRHFFKMDIELHTQEQPTSPLSLPNDLSQLLEAGHSPIILHQTDEADPEFSSSTKDKSIREQFQAAGFAMNNQSLLCVQVANALHAQLNVVQRIIAQKSNSSFLNSNIGLEGDDRYAFQQLQQWQYTYAQPIFEASALKKKSKDQQNHNKVPFIGGKMDAQAEQIVFRPWDPVSTAQKMLYLQLRKKVEEVKRAVSECITSKRGNWHVCMLCGDSFKTGRQLGGHMSRKHPGNSDQHTLRKRVQRSKAIERDRRRYFKSMRLEQVTKQRPIIKHQVPCLPSRENI